MSNTAIQTMEDKEAARLINDIAKKIEAGTKKSSIPEHLYNANFKPYIEDGEEVKDDNPILVKWVELAGGAHNEVDVLDNTGKITKTVPPIVDRSKIDMNISNRVDYAGITSEFELQRARHPNLGENYLGGQLTQVAKAIIIQDKPKVATPTEPVTISASKDSGYDLDY